jgi:hypothetical protein
MLMSAIYLAISVNVPVLAQDVSGPITGGTYGVDVEVTAGQVPNYTNNYMAGVSATDNNVSVGNNLSVTSDTGSTVAGVYVTDAEVSVGNDLSVNSESTNTRGIDAEPNAGETAAVTIRDDLTVDSRNTPDLTIGIEARPAATGTANITVGNPLTNQGDVTVTVTGTADVRGISIAANNTGVSSQGNTNITVGGNVTSNGGNAKGVFLQTRADTITNVDIGGAVNANGNTRAMGLDIHPSGNNTNKIDVENGISASAAEATGVVVQATNTSNTTINIGKDSSGNAITVHSNGDNGNAANSFGISATGDDYNGSTTARINVEGNIVVSSEVAGSRGIYANGGDRTNLNIQVKGDVTSNGAGIYTEDMSLAQSTDIIIDGTVKSTADGIPAVILDDSSINNGQVSITAWKIESNEGTALFGKNDGAGIQINDNSQNAVAGHISYIIRVTQPEINNTPANVLSLAKADGTAWDNKKAWNNGAGVAPTMLNVAGETQKVYVKIDVPAGYQLAGVYADSARTVALTQDENGSYYLIVPRGGGIDVNVALTLVPAPRPQPSPNTSYVIDPDILSLFANILGTGTDNYTVEVASGETEQSVAPEQLSEIYAAQIQSKIESALAESLAVANGKAVTVIDLEFGNDPSFTADAVMALCNGRVAKRVHFTHNGKKYVLFVPVMDTTSTAYSQCLASLNAESGRQAGPLRLAQIFAPVGLTVSRE